ncbi:LysR substrate-binding domain-containing protein [Maricaulis sp.]|uniref:LysR substrate-binding domain-containing protein n=1 Tax=Maricaulis sp. TaxID=1486257 RepID=UPI00261A8555|nr:LysR substrate-binding domain-containing protein [Maricaulis sp.]
MDLNDYYYFVHVVEKQGFASAGRALGVPKSRLSRHIAQLEDRLGARLIQRTSRQFVVTDVGMAFYNHARTALDAIEAAETTVRQKTHDLSGRVRLSCSVGIAQFALSRILADFLEENPKVDVIQNVTNQAIDLVESGMDIALRGHAGPLPDSTLIQTKLAATPWHLFAAPAYLDRAGHPETPDALLGHAGLKIGWKPETGQWTLHGGGDVTASIPFQPRLCSDDMLSLKQAAARGLGIVALPAYVCRDDEASGRLVRVLPDWIAGDAQISLLMPSRQGILPAVEALAGFLRRSLPEIVRT